MLKFRDIAQPSKAEEVICFYALVQGTYWMQLWHMNCMPALLPAINFENQSYHISFSIHIQ